MELVKLVSRTACLKFIQFNYLHHMYHHMYLMPHLLHRMFPGIAPLRPRCTHPNAAFLLMVGRYPNLAGEWVQMMEHTSAVVDVKLLLDPCSACWGLLNG